MPHHPATQIVASPQRTTVEGRCLDITPNQSKPALVSVLSKSTGSDAILTPVAPFPFGSLSRRAGELLNPHLPGTLAHFRRVRHRYSYEECPVFDGTHGPPANPLWSSAVAQAAARARQRAEGPAGLDLRQDERPSELAVMRPACRVGRHDEATTIIRIRYIMEHCSSCLSPFMVAAMVNRAIPLPSRAATYPGLPLEHACQQDQ